MPARRIALDALTQHQREVLDATGDLLVAGRPGTGKTSIALLKAVQHVTQSQDPNGQVLFLSFSRAAVQRIEAAASFQVPRKVAQRLVVTTFHAFCHDCLRSHARLCGLPRLAGVVLPREERIIAAEAATEALIAHRRQDSPLNAILARVLELIDLPEKIHAEEPDPLVRDAVRQARAELARLERGHGRVRFGRLIELAIDIFARHEVLRLAYARAYPLVVVDEYQDTDDRQDALIDLLAVPGQVVYLGDPDQRIYDWLPDVRHDRFERLIARRGPRRIDLPPQCHRSGTSDLVSYGRAVLSGETLPREATTVTVWRYRPKAFAHGLRMGIVTLEKRLRRLLGPTARPEIAIMAYKNDFVARISRELRQTTDSFVHPFHHRLQVGLEEIGPAWALALSLLACPRGSPAPQVVAEALHQLGRNERASGGKQNLKRATTLFQTAEAYRTGGSIAARSLRDLPDRVAAVTGKLTGDPRRDIPEIVALLRTTGGGYFDDVIDTLDMRSPSEPMLCEQLAESYQSHGFYRDAPDIGEAFLVREHLLRAEAGRGGRILMTLHKCKGKEFDGVVIVDGPGDADGLVLPDDDASQTRSRRLLSMAIARARHHVVIVTPVYRPCPLLPGQAGTASSRSRKRGKTRTPRDHA